MRPSPRGSFVTLCGLNTNMDAYTIRFEGRVLSRGFWLYVVAIESPAGPRLYVGRTGDSSSPNASSPFARIGQHLDARAHAKGNALGRNLREAGLDPTQCSFNMIAVGPVFAEVKDFEAHKPIRDQVAALEHALASHLRSNGHVVLGNHSSRVPVDGVALADVIKCVEARLGNGTAA